MKKNLLYLICVFCVASASCKRKNTPYKNDASHKASTIATPVKNNNSQILKADYERLTSAITHNAQNVDSLVSAFVKTNNHAILRPHKASKITEDDYAYSAGYADVYTYVPNHRIDEAHFGVPEKRATKQRLFNASAVLNMRGNVIHIKIPVSYLDTEGKWEVASTSSGVNRIKLSGPAVGSILKSSEYNIVNMFYEHKKGDAIPGIFEGGGIELRISSRDQSGHVSITPNFTGEQIKAIAYFDQNQKLLSSRANCTSDYEYQGVFLFRRHPGSKRPSITYALSANNTGMQTND